MRLTFNAASANADNNAGNNSFVVRVRLIASNVTGNQAGVTRPNSAQVIYSDPDGDTPNGSTALDRTVALSGSQPSVSIVEPTLTVTQTQTNNGGPLGVDRNDEITYTITIRNDSGINAFDIGFLDTVPSQLIFSEPGFGLQSLTYAGGATNNGGPDFVVLGSAIVTDPAANIDIPTGGSITLVIKGRVRSDLGSINDIVNTATAQWTSLDGTTTVPTTGERSGVDGLLNSGVLNDYRTSQLAHGPGRRRRDDQPRRPAARHAAADAGYQPPANRGGRRTDLLPRRLPGAGRRHQRCERGDQPANRLVVCR